MRIFFISLVFLLIILHSFQAKGDVLNVTRCTNCSVDQSKFIQDAVTKWHETVFSKCFVEFMVDRKFENTDKAGGQVLESIMMTPVVVEAEMYYSFKRVLGYTLPNKPKIWINRKYMQKWNRCDLASLLAHEASHKIGYGHDFYATKRRPYSVPYSLNAAFKKCCVR